MRDGVPAAEPASDRRRRPRAAATTSAVVTTTLAVARLTPSSMIRLNSSGGATTSSASTTSRARNPMTWTAVGRGEGGDPPESCPARGAATAVGAVRHREDELGVPIPRRTSRVGRRWSKRHRSGPVCSPAALSRSSRARGSAEAACSRSAGAGSSGSLRPARPRSAFLATAPFAGAAGSAVDDPAGVVELVWLDDGGREPEAPGLLARRPSDRSRRSRAPGRSQRRRRAAGCPRGRGPARATSRASRSARRRRKPAGRTPARAGSRLPRRRPGRPRS